MPVTEPTKDPEGTLIQIRVKIKDRTWKRTKAFGVLHNVSLNDLVNMALELYLVCHDDFYIEEVSKRLKQDKTTLPELMKSYLSEYSKGS